MKPNGVKPTIDGPHYAHPCQCDHSSCKAWHVANVADVQGVSFTKAQAMMVADFLNAMDVLGEPPQFMLDGMAAGVEARRRQTKPN